MVKVGEDLEQVEVEAQQQEEVAQRPGEEVQVHPAWGEEVQVHPAKGEVVQRQGEVAQEHQEEEAVQVHQLEQEAKAGGALVHCPQEPGAVGLECLERAGEVLHCWRKAEGEVLQWTVSREAWLEN